MAYMNKILRVDLTSGKITDEKLDEQTAKMFIGGRGLGAKIISDEVDPKTDPLSAANKIVFTTGPLTGTKAPTSGRFSASFKSPLTNTLTDCHAGGHFGPWLKWAGYDALIIQGKADEHVYLSISDETVELFDASEVWGKNTSETDDILRKKHDGKVICIGPAGEKQSLISSIMVNAGRALGRGGIGAVLGSKQLKAIVASGSQKIAIQNGGFDRAVFEATALLKEKAVTGESLPSRGTTVLVHVINMNGMYPVKNFQESQWPFDKAELTSGERIRDEFFSGRQGCYGCPIVCGHKIKLEDGREFKSPEFETVWSFGADMDNTDFATIAEAGALCDQYGLDTISAGATIAAAMELEEMGKINEGLKWGDCEAILQAVHMMGKGKGFGEELAKGSKVLCEKYGAPEVSMTVKGMEMPAYDPRGAKGMGLAYATSNRGGCHLRAYMVSPEVLGTPKEMLDRFSTDGKARWTIDFQDISAFVDSLVLCRFTQFSLGIDNYAEMYAAATGMDFDAADLMKAGARIYNIERMYNLSAGLSKEDDTLPDRLLNARVTAGPSRGQTVKLKGMRKEYYDLRGWSKEGVPEAWRLKEYGLEGGE
ncbi:MAG: aldehyde ferredoxin oxidoreductase family protein [Methanosarcinales archaeon]|nr:aldehyde ferredoxin oxidoreductase family protein [Methanosarcinales archaeon]